MKKVERVLKWSLPLLVAAEIVLVRLGIFGLREVVLLVIGIEVLLLLLGTSQLFAATRRYRRGTAGGLDRWAALEEGLAVVLPRSVAKIVVLEPRLWVCFVRWALGRRRYSEEEFSYHRRSPLGMLVVMVLLVSPVELLLLHLLIPWTWLKILLLVVGIYGAFWVLGFYASLVTLPHRLEEDGLLLRYGVFARGFVPYADVVAIQRDRKVLSKGELFGDVEGLRVLPDEDTACFAIASKTDVLLKLNHARSMEKLLRSTPPVNCVRFAVDEPEDMVRRLRQQIEAPSWENPNTDDTVLPGVEQR